jgi:hypothetical protein
VSTTAFLAALGGYGWWSSTVELAAPVVASGPLALQACTSADADAAKTCLRTSAIFPTIAVAKSRTNESRHETSVKKTSTPTFSKVLIVVFLFLFEAIFLYVAGQSLGIGKKRRSTYPIAPVSKFGFFSSEENLPSDLGCVEPTLQPESKDFDSALPIFDIVKECSAISSPPAPEPSCELACNKDVECKSGVEAILKVASPVRRSSRVE